MNARAGRTPRPQGGMALMVFMIILVLAVSAGLLARLHPGAVAELHRERVTADAMAEAKAALFAWAVAHPAGSSGAPGVLPYPDRNDGDGNYDGQGECPNPVTGPGQLLGRFPWQGEGSGGCEAAPIGVELADGAGEPLWYAVSQNLVTYPGPGAAPINPGLLDLDPPPFPWLVVRDAAGNVISDRVAAVVLAAGDGLDTRDPAGNPLAQDRSGVAPDPEHFLDSFAAGAFTLSNSDSDGCPDDDPAPCAGNEGEDFYLLPPFNGFNDRLAYITIDELMRRVERRAAAEAARILREFKAVDRDPGAGAFHRYPWLAPFPNPRVRPPLISGTASAGSGAGFLQDGQADFVAADVANGDRVHNRENGQVAAVTGVNATDLSVTPAITFSASDRYQVSLAGGLPGGTAGAGSDAETLADPSLGTDLIATVTPGDILRNITDGSAGITARVTAQTATLVELDPVNFPDVGLVGGTNNQFAPGTDDYGILQPHGRVTAGSDTMSPTDADADFGLLDLAPGRAVVNLDDGSAGRVDSVTGTTSFTVEALFGGAENDFDVNDRYRVSAFAGEVGTRFGQIPVHLFDHPFRTGFRVAWDLTGHSVVRNTPLPGGNGDFYGDDLETFTRTSAFSGAREVSYARGVCIWTTRAQVDCRGQVRERVIAGTAGPDTDANPATLEDTTRDFDNGWGIEVGDQVDNLDPVAPLATGTAGTDSDGDPLTLDDDSADFVSAAVQPGDVVINTTDGSIGTVTAVFLSGTRLEVEALTGGQNNRFADGDSYTVFSPARGIVTAVTANRLTIDGLAGGFAAGDPYHVRRATAEAAGTATGHVSNFLQAPGAPFADVGVGDSAINETTGQLGTVVTKVSNAVLQVQDGAGNNVDFPVGHAYRVRWDFVDTREYQLRISSTGDDLTAGQRRAFGYADPKTRDVSLDGPYLAPPGAPTASITLVDRDAAGIEVGRASVTAVAGVDADLDVDGIHMDLEAGQEIPDWFYEHQWYKYLLVAVAAEEAPDGGGDCTGACLSLTDQGGAVSYGTDLEAVVVSPGVVLAGRDRVLGGTCTALGSRYLCDYFDTGNDDGDDAFVRADAVGNFNDVAAPVCRNIPGDLVDCTP